MNSNEPEQHVDVEPRPFSRFTQTVISTAAGVVGLAATVWILWSWHHHLWAAGLIDLHGAMRTPMTLQQFFGESIMWVGIQIVLLWSAAATTARYLFGAGALGLRHMVGLLRPWLFAPRTSGEQSSAELTVTQSATKEKS